jgi:hypothetical protein
MAAIGTNQFAYVDICGVGNSGKSAISDLLSEFDAIYMPEYWFEFDLIRVPDGLLELRQRLVENWSPVRSHYAVAAFRRLVHMMGRDPGWWNMAGHWVSTGHRLDRRFDRQYRAQWLAFVDSFVRMELIAEWGYDEMQMRPELRLIRKAIRHIGGRRRLRRVVRLVDGKDFDVKVRNVMDALFALIAPPDADIIGLHNCFEPYNPIPALDMMGNAKQIIVTRDPRDIYVSGQTAAQVKPEDKALLPFDNDGLNKSFLATDDLAAFVTRMRLLHEQLFCGHDPRVLRLRFEDIVLDYDRTVDRVCKFLGIDRARHRRPRTKLVPEKSAKNVGLWRRYSSQQEVDYIAREMPDLLYP